MTAPPAATPATSTGAASTRCDETPAHRSAEAPTFALLLRLHEAGIPDTGLERLVQLRAAHRGTSLTLDGFVPDPRARFARWLYLQGRLRD